MAMTGIVGILTVIGEHFWLVVIACVEVIVALLLIGFAAGRKRQNRGSVRSEISGMDRDFLEAYNDWRDEASMMVRRSDLLPVYATDGFSELLGYTLKALQADIRHIGSNMADPEPATVTRIIRMGMVTIPIRTRIQSRQQMTVTILITTTATMDLIQRDLLPQQRILR